jgi:hypothetical protein
MAFRFYLDNQLTDQPMNDMELSTTIKRNSSLGALLITQDVELSYNGNNDPEPLEISGYSYLKGKFDTGSCQEVAIRIIDDSDPTQTIEIYNGVIKVPSIRFDLQRVVAKCKVQDNSFYAYINNNKSIKYDIQSPTTKNGILISPPTGYLVDVFLGCDGTPLLTPAKGYRVYDVFQYLVAAISDNKVAFYSNFLQTEPEVFIFDGFALQNQGATPSVKTSFGALFNEMNKIFNLSFYIDNTDPTNPTMIMEKTSDLFSGLNQVEFLDIKDLQSNIREDNLYGTVKAGSDYNPIGSDQVYTIPGVSYYSFGEEIFTPKGQCNIDNELDLVNQFKISNNAVNDQINGGVSGYDDDLFLIECNLLNTVTHVASAVSYTQWTPPNPACPLARYYNYNLSNLQKLANYGNALQTTLFNTLTVGVGGYQASQGSETLLISSDPQYIANYITLPETILTFGNFTSSGNYNAGQYSAITGRYTANANGSHSFAANYNFDCDNLKSCLGNFTITTAGPGLPIGSYTTIFMQDCVYVTAYIRIYDAANNLLSTQSAQTIISAGMESSQLGVNYVVDMASTDYAEFSIEANIYKRVNFPGNNNNSYSVFPVGAIFSQSLPLHPNFGYQISGNPWATWNWSFCTRYPHINIFLQADSITACTGIPSSGITLTVPNQGTFESYEYTFDYDISQTDWLNIVSQPTTLFIFEKDNQQRIGWIDTMKRNDWTGLTQIKLVTNNAVTTQ